MARTPLAATFLVLAVTSSSAEETIGSWTEGVAHILKSMNDSAQRQEALALERQRAEAQAAQAQREAQARDEWCPTAMAELGRADLNDFQKLAIFESMKNRGCMGTR